MIAAAPFAILPPLITTLLPPCRRLPPLFHAAADCRIFAISLFISPPFSPPPMLLRRDMSLMAPLVAARHCHPACFAAAAHDIF
jgi:hypothetical protein